MPELPEVETVVRGVRDALVGRTITGVSLDWPAGLATPDSTLFVARIAGQTVQRVDRRGKYIVISLDPDTLIIHLKMTGRLYVVPDAEEQYADRWVHFTFQLDNAHQLRFSDSRKFGRVYLVEDPAEVTGALGPEPLSDSFTLETFRARLAGRSGALKPLLLNQTFLAGMGNIYVDEALFASGLHPLRRADSLGEDDVARLYAAIRHVLDEGVRREGASVNWYRKPDGTKGSAQNGLNVYGQTGRPCPRCGTPVIKTVVGQRGTHLCPTCQK
ncbi:MAG TPA: bifunctional DNA-formamidopyrimidine glycosylase/DNA-(apurinic or apyrimidinic site) lyase [Aggregatilinea sp.]|uniref:bifunctional DNA-formamidopyrimidine glycosylase/DNA-(apurinic or apyrimidinic site) lyase n=1 Tax=Aggregatilinea sp. TaxID=2806333 RepID=UPI002CD692D4|nr:bifunctional DNA-formamidopyrimidine glycosylase/DNA-(apurinic or apyrimidinic site) lyase [Aggregatilinea sp.]HML24843.1 bifunctional DNA-formamidopyrimidine glycosylase/DNA-(apurinic or apyrimidinic site) lyase [Aggregatilinea sp.]